MNQNQTSNDVPTLEHAVSGDRHILNGRAGPMSYYSAGSGEPVLLLHSINAAPSVAEMAPLFEHLCHSRRVFAPDLPGFGFSDRSKRTYSIELYVNAINDMLDQIEKELPGQPIDAIGLSLSSEFLARVAVKQPERFRSLTLITPTGFQKGANKLRAPEGTTRFMPVLNAVLSFRLWNRALYRGLTRPKVIRYFLRRTNGAPEVDETLASYCEVTTDQPGAEHAPFVFLSGALFSKDIRTIYEALTQPVFVPHATRGDFADFREAQWTKTRDNWHLKPYNSGAMPHFDARQAFIADLDNFLANPVKIASL